MPTSANRNIEFGLTANYYQLYNSDMMSVLNYFNNFPHANTVIELNQSNFDNGTYRIKTPGYYRLTEDIIFLPNKNISSSTTPGDDINVLDNFFPTPAQKRPDGDYPAPPYQLGFFAAITVEANGVVIDLNGFSIRQHILHNIQQRFFACIELASSPFIPRQGPSDFGNSIVKPENVYIKNGTIGLSSHHGIHGNGMKNVIIENIIFSDYEIGGIALNGGENILVRNIFISNNSIKVPVKATYSHAIFMRSFLKNLKAAVRDASLNIHGRDTKTISTIITELDTEMINNVYLNGLRGQPIASTLFKNVTGLVDGDCYGLLFNPLGVAVEDFRLDRTGTTGNQNIVVHDVAINNVTSKAIEVISLSNNNQVTAPLKGPVGEVVRIFDITDSENNNIYNPDVLANGWFILAKYKNNGDFTSTGTLNLPRELVSWVESSTNLTTVINDNGLKYINLHDSMFHYTKGNIPLFISSVNGFKGEYINIDNCTNQGNAGDENPSRVLDYNNALTVGKVNANLYYKRYQGASTRNICITGSVDVELNWINISNSKSENNCCFGFDLIGSCDNITIKDSIVNFLKSGSIFNSSLHDRIMADDSTLPAGFSATTVYPNPDPKTFSCNVDSSCTNIKTSNIGFSKRLQKVPN